MGCILWQQSQYNSITDINFVKNLKIILSKDFQCFKQFSTYIYTSS